MKTHTRFCVKLRPGEIITLRDGTVIENTCHSAKARLTILSPVQSIPSTLPTEGRHESKPKESK